MDNSIINYEKKYVYANIYAKIYVLWINSNLSSFEKIQGKQKWQVDGWLYIFIENESLSKFW